MRVVLASVSLVFASAVFADSARMERLSVLLTEGYEVVPVGAGFVVGLKKGAELFLCVVNEDQTSMSFNVRQTLLNDQRLGSESLVANEAVPVLCFQAR